VYSVFALASLAALAAGCGGGPNPSSAVPPPRSGLAPANAVSSASDSVGGVPGSKDAQFVYKFKQIEPPSTGTFSFKDRDLSFSFRPSPNVFYIGIENLQGRPVQIDWDRSVFYDANGRQDKVAHNTTRWRDRYSSQTPAQILPQQRYTDYVFPIDDLLDPGPNPDEQLRRPLLPEDASAPTYSGKTFGVDLVMMVENQPRTYTIRFQVQSAIPR
jgi:hypothetical protein